MERSQNCNIQIFLQKKNIEKFKTIVFLQKVSELWFRLNFQRKGKPSQKKICRFLIPEFNLLFESKLARINSRIYNLGSRSERFFISNNWKWFIESCVMIHADSGDLKSYIEF